MKTKNYHFLTKLFASCFYLGHIPFAPGTAASIVAAATLYLLPPISLLVHFVIINVLFLAGAVISEKASQQTKTKDAPWIVIDEWFGMWLALFLVPKSILTYALALVIFRIFDIVKPNPISYIENNTPGGLGIMLMLKCLDNLEYNYAGNQVKLSKYIK